MSSTKMANGYGECRDAKAKAQWNVLDWWRMFGVPSRGRTNSKKHEKEGREKFCKGCNP